MADEAVPEAQQKSEIVVSSKALQVAEGWVRDMMAGQDWDSDAENSSTAQLEPRPPRLGLGAKYLPHSQFAAILSPVDRKLRAMTNAGKQREGRERIGNHSFPLSTGPPSESKCDVESDDDEEVKGSSRVPHGRQQRRIGSADLLMKTAASKGKSKKRKR